MYAVFEVFKSCLRSKFLKFSWHNFFQEPFPWVKNVMGREMQTEGWGIIIKRGGGGILPMGALVGGGGKGRGLDLNLNKKKGA